MKSVYIKYLKRLGIIISVSFVLASCQNPNALNEEEAIKEIITLHELQKKYHFEKMTEEFASLLSEDHISVNRGEINMPTKEENMERFEGYFNAVEFEKWDDVNPPIIKFSNDYSLAYTVVDKEVIVTFEDAEGKPQRESTKFCWVAIYRKYEDGWKIDCVSSTNKPSEIMNINSES